MISNMERLDTLVKYGVAAILLMFCVVMAVGQTATVTDVSVDKGSSSNSKVIVVSVLLEDNQKMAVTFASSLFALLDSRDNFYESTSVSNGSGVWFSMRLNPGTTQTATLRFEVPESFDVNFSTLTLCMYGADRKAGGGYQSIPLRLKSRLAPAPLYRPSIGRPFRCSTSGEPTGT
jgi:hypothetical protein